jgi:hypothetical protein
MALKWELELPDRLDYALYAPLMSLSVDQTHLYYATRTHRDIPACAQGGDAAMCDLIGLGIVDLQSRALLSGVELPGGCGWPSLSSAAGQSVVAACTGEPIAFVVSPSGVVRSEAFDLGVQPKGSSSRGGLRPILGFLTAGGELGVVSESGRIHIARGGTIQTFDVLPAGARPAPRGQVSVVDGSTVMMPFSQTSDGRVDGVILFDLSSLKATRKAVSPARWVGLIDGGLVAITLNGTVVRTDQSGATTPTKLASLDDTAALAR